MTAATRLVPRALLAAAVVTLIVLAAVWRDQIDLAALDRRLGALGPWAPAGYVAIYAAATVAFVPGAIFGLAGGALFGPLWGSLWNLLGATLGATLAFLIARYVAADRVGRIAGGRLARLIAGVDAEGWRFVALLRLVPLFPFNLVNYALGLTRIPLSHYVAASLVCMAPGTVAYTWLGHAGRGALAGEADAIRWGLLALGAIAAVAFVPRIAGRLRARPPLAWIEADALAQRLARGEPIVVLDVRGADEFDGPLGHVAGARNVPVGDLEQRRGELAGLTRSPIVLVCRTDKRSATAAHALAAAGFADVAVLRRGMEQWNEAGLPVERRAVEAPTRESP